MRAFPVSRTRRVLGRRVPGLLKADRLGCGQESQPGPHCVQVWQNCVRQKISLALYLSHLLCDPGKTWRLCWVYLGYILGISWLYLGYILGISQVYLGYILGISWVYLGYILGVSWVYLGYILGTSILNGKNLKIFFQVISPAKN